jgi:biotin carboxyl carrier protein
MNGVLCYAKTLTNTYNPHPQSQSSSSTTVTSPFFGAVTKVVAKETAEVRAFLE